VGAMLKPGTVIQTAADSYVDVVLNDREAAATGLASPDAASSASATSATTEDMAQYQPKARQDAIRVFENSVLGIDKLTVTETGADTVTETQLDLKAGRIFGTVKKLSAASKYEVKLPNGVAGIRGTIYLIGANGVVSVLSGSVVISYVGPSGSVVTQVVKAGQQFDPNVTDPAQQVGPLPPAVVKFIVPLAKIFDRFLPEPRPTTYVGADKTVYSVTPTK
jgi:hypothetical protein